ncbi:MAG: AAA family ATPase [Anaerolineales bacterium]|nr:MAG: AAA family ATPase [Anaerolineales bacterium]
MDLFDHVRQEQIAREAPLAARMRPRTLDEFVGQEHIVGPGRLLRRAIQADQLSSLIFYGPPGTGKTTLARIIANTTQAHFIAINAVLAGVKNIREAIAVAQERRGMYAQRTILFVDEVHRFNKAQQDALLPHVENGTIILVGATTENPYFEVIKALVSRSRIFELRRLSEEDLRHIADQALTDPERGYGRLQVQIDQDALDHLVNVANGDARGVLNALELAVETTLPTEQGIIRVDLAVAEESIQRRAVLYDKDGDVHFDTISAFIKSLRGSDPDAALYWLARMLYAGEDPRFMFRRMLIFAGEDVGMADPNAVRVVTACAQAFDYVGLPEGRFHLAEACIYLATAPKSNSAFALFDAIAAVEREREEEVPDHLKDASRDAEDLGHGQGYLYPHAYRDHWVTQQYLPESLQGRVFYRPTDQGHEAEVKEQVTRHREAQLAAMLEQEHSPVAIQDERGHEQKEAAPPTYNRWLQRTLSNVGEQLSALRDRVIKEARLERHSLVLDLNAATGLLMWEAVRRTPVGGVWALAADEQTAKVLREQAIQLEALSQPIILSGTLEALPDLIAAQLGPQPESRPGQAGIHFDAVIGRNVLTRHPDKATAAHIIASLLSQAGRLSLAEVVPHHAQRLYRLVDLSPLDETLRQQLITAEEAIYANPDDPMVNWDRADLEAAFSMMASVSHPDTGQGTQQARSEMPGLSDVHIQVETVTAQQLISPQHLVRWFSISSDHQRPTYAQHLRHYLSTDELGQVQALFEHQLRDQTVAWTSQVLYLSAHK